MGGVVKGIGKAFKAVGNFVKKYWKAIVIAVVVAAAIYFTAGMALSAMPEATGTIATSAEAGSASYTGLAVESAVAADSGTAATAASGFLSADAAAATDGLTVGAASDAAGLSFDAATAGTGVADAAATTANVAAGAADAGGLPGITSSAPSTDLTSLAEVNVPESSGATESMASKTAKAVADIGKDTETASKGFWGGMSTGEKLMFASTAFNTAAGLLKKPTRQQLGLWPGGSFFGVNADGSGQRLGTAPTPAAPTNNPNPGSVATEGQAKRTVNMIAQGQQQQDQYDQEAVPDQQSTAPDFLPTSQAVTAAQGAQSATQAATQRLDQGGQQDQQFIQGAMRNGR